jgi:hypothetical protein
MTEKEFKKHLQDLAHGHHHPEEHDWADETSVRTTAQPAKTKLSKPAKSVAPKAKRRVK